MIFNSVEFVIFLPVVFALYWLARGYRRQNLLVVFASYVFYGWWDWRFLALIFLTSLVAYACALLMGRGAVARKGWCAVAVVFNVGVLSLFKYYDFFVESLATLAAAMGWRADWPMLHLILPVGISFYTFQALGYTIDVYRGHLRPTRDVVAFFAYISFFPQLVAGPIERATRLLPQFHRARRFDEAQAADGVRQMLWGFFKKMVVADNCAVAVDGVWDNCGAVGSGTLLLAAILFSFQIYGDFSGYSDIAIGCSRLFGMELTRNFRYPYFADNIADFWRRWHISLTSWFRDYVYIPLGGSHGSRGRTLRNIVVVWIISGLWHGANWTFICWGMYHAGLLVAHRLWGGRWHAPQWVCVPLTFALVTTGWILFRAPGLEQAARYLAMMWPGGRIPAGAGLELTRWWIAVPAIALMLVAEWRARDRRHVLQWPADTRMASSLTLRYAVYVALAGVICVFSGTRAQFIYFQF